jgi:hypothetical protein
MGAMNLLPPEKLAAVEKCFNEGRGIRETERLTGVHRDTVSRYFRLLAAPPKEPDEEQSVSANYEVVEHDNDWHVFCWHDSTPEWWRHVATFHSEQRARFYAADQAAWVDNVAAEGIKQLEDDGVGGVAATAAEALAPIERLPEPPPTAPAATEDNPAAAERPLTREERKAATEKRLDELAAALPPRHCEVCGVKLERRVGEPVNNFGVRKTCSHEHAQELIRGSIARRQSPDNWVDAHLAAPPEVPRGTPDEDEPAPAPAAEAAVEENETIEEATSFPLAAAPDESREIATPGYKNCHDCLWSGPVRDYRFHRETDHA